MLGFGDLSGIMGKVKEMQSNMEKKHEELKNKTIEASSGGGVVTAKINGKFELLELKIDRKAVDMDDIEMLEDLIKAAVNAAVAKCQEEIKAEIAELTGGMNIPGMDKIGAMLGLK